MTRHERLNAILELIAERGSLTVDELTEAFAVSPATARRDFDDLASQQLVTRTHGGAVAQSVTYDLPMRYKSGRQTDQKDRIAAAAAELAPLGAVIALNGGTTTSAVARALAVRTDTTDAARRAGGEASPFTVVTNALNIANELAVRPHLKVVVVGGVLRPLTFELVGPFARHVLQGLAIDVTFLGVDAISSTDGPAAANELEAETNRSMVERSGRVVVVADSSKLERRSFTTICDLASVDLLITGTEADPAAVRAFVDAGLAVQQV